MNLRTHSSATPLPSARTHSLKNSSNGKVSVEDKNVNNNDSKISVFKSEYFDNLRSQILTISKITKKQKVMVIKFLEVFEDIIEQNHINKTTLKGVKSNDDEICIYRKTADGISMIAIDEDGDGFYNFTGNKDSIETIFFEYENPNIETLTYKFFSK
jgi:hypothetical protein